MRKPLNNPMPPQSTGIAKLLETKSQMKQMKKTMMMADAMSMASKMKDDMKVKSSCK
jgi:hypothetical protein